MGLGEMKKPMEGIVGKWRIKRMENGFFKN
jgi:hypothetical protein